MVKPDRASPDPTAYTGCLDLDGTLNEFRGWTGKYELYNPLRGVEQFLQGLRDDGWDLVISTARPNIEDVKVQLSEWGWMDKYIKEVTHDKPLAMFYVDDKAVYFDGNFVHTRRDIRRLESWYAKNPGFLSRLWQFVVSFMELLNDFYSYSDYENEWF
jgi:hypothetical protein